MSISRSLSDVPEEVVVTPKSPNPSNSPYSNSSSPALSSTTTLGQPKASSSASATSNSRNPSGSNGRTPSLRTLGGRSSTGDSTLAPSIKRNASSSSKDLRAGAKKPTSSSPLPKFRSIPSLPHDKRAEAAPSTAMYWSRAPAYGAIPHRTMRSPTVTLLDSTAWVFGGNEDGEVNNDMKHMYCFDIETMEWTQRETTGDIPPPCRAHTATLVDRKIIIVCGGYGPRYYDSVYVLDTMTRNWTQPVITGPKPVPRRSHTAILYQQKIWIFGGGTGGAPLNDVWALDVSHMSRMKWEHVETTGRMPPGRGYHTANLVGNIMIVVGGSSWDTFYSDVFCLDLHTQAWSQIHFGPEYRRLAHSATQVGSFLYVVQGHDSVRYLPDVLPFNLVSLQYEPRMACGRPPSARGYHATILADSRVFLFGGFDGNQAFEEVYILDLAASAYLPQVTSFNVEL